MTLPSNIPSDKRRPGTFLTFDDTSGSRGLITVTRTLAIVAAKLAAGTATANTPIQVFGEDDAITYFGQGSECHLMVAMVLAQCRKLDTSAPQIWVVPVADPGGTAATFTFTIAGTATEAGDLVVRVAGRTIRATVDDGDSNTTVATALNAAIAKHVASLPVTAGVAAGVVTCTANQTGVNGNDIAIETVSAPAGITCTAAVGVAGVGVVDLTTALDAMGSRNYNAIAIANHAAQDVTDLGSHMDAMWAAAKKRFRFAFMGETGTLATATTNATSADRKEIVIVSCEDSPSLPGELAAAAAAVSQSQERPSHNYDATELAVYAPPDASVYDDAEVETALAGGVTPVTATDTGAVIIERLVTTKHTQDGAAFDTLLDFSVPYTEAYYGWQLDARLKRAIKGQNADATLEADLRDIAIDVLRQGEEVGDLQHVDDHLDEVQVAAHPSVPSRFLLEWPLSVVPNAHQVDTTVRLFVEGA